MVTYLAFYTIFLLFCMFDYVNIDKIVKTLLLFGCFVVSSIFLGTRVVGPDYHTYKSYYDIIPGFPELLSTFKFNMVLSRFEPLFLIQIGIFKTFQLPFSIFHFLFTASFVALFFLRIGKYTPYVFTATFIYIAFAYLSGWSALRQFMATSIFFYALQYLVEGKKMKYIFYIFIACLFHVSALVLLPIAFYGNRRVNNIVVIFSLLLVSFLNLSNILEKTAHVLLTILPIFNAEKISLSLAGRTSFINTIVIFWFVILFFMMYFKNILRNRYLNFELFYNIFWISLFVYIFASSFGSFNRVLMYFKILYPIVIPMCVFVFKETSGRILVFCGVALISYVLFVRTINEMDGFQIFDNDKFIPYKTFLKEGLEGIPFK